MSARFREPVNGFTHLAGAVAACGGLAWLVLAARHDPPLLVALIIYGLSAIFVFSASAFMHLYVGSKHAIKWLTRLDHAAIYIMIAGTYTPIVYVYLDGAWRWGLLITVWTMAIAGVVYKLLRWEEDSVLSTLYYLAMGWLAVLAVPQALPHVPTGAVLLLLAGGAVYSGGALIFILRRPNFSPTWGFHEIWHLCVLAGFGLHFLAVALYMV